MTQIGTRGGKPWGEGCAAFWEGLAAAEAVVLGVIDPHGPRPDALLTTRGVDAATLEHWCESGFKEDALLREARRKGVAVGEGGAEDRPGAASSLPTGHQAMVHVLPASLTEARAWYLALGRPGRGFDKREQERTALALRWLAAAFDQVPEPGLERVLLGQGARLIHADALTEARMLDEPRFLHDLAHSLEPMVAQRWPELADETVHDAALVLGGRRRWVRLHRARAAPELAAYHWHVELRPLEEDDIPPLGVVDDERVARAVAYLSDHFDRAPTLGDVAEAVHTSPFHFHRLFVRHVGRSPKHYLLRMQIMLAKWLLRATRTNIGEIATATGFASHGHFTATFHRVVGQSPSQYRETA